MIMLKFKLIILLMIGLMVSAMAAVKFNDVEKPILVSKAKPVFSITLKSNHTTGYRWLLTKYNSDLIQPTGVKYYYSSDKKLVGAAGYEVWSFKLKPACFKVPQVMDVALVYARTWEDLADVKPVVFKVVTNES